MLASMGASRSKEVVVVMSQPRIRTCHSLTPLVCVISLVLTPASVPGQGPRVEQWYDEATGKTWVLTPHVTEVVVRFAPEVGATSRSDVVTGCQLGEVRPFNAAHRLGTYDVPPGQTFAATVALLRTRSEVEGVLPTFIDQDGYTRRCIFPAEARRAVFISIGFARMHRP